MWVQLTTEAAANKQGSAATYRYEEDAIYPHKIKDDTFAPVSEFTTAELDALCILNPKVKALVEALQSISIMQTPDIMREVAKRALAAFKAAE